MRRLIRSGEPRSATPATNARRLDFQRSDSGSSAKNSFWQGEIKRYASCGLVGDKYINVGAAASKDRVSPLVDFDLGRYANDPGRAAACCAYQADRCTGSASARRPGLP